MRARGWGAIGAALSLLCTSTGCSKSAASTPDPGSAAIAPQECTGLPPPPARRASYRVGFVQIYEPTNPYTAATTKDLLAEAKKRGVELVYEPPTSADPNEQIRRMQSLIAARVDAIVARPDTALGPTIVQARKACIPVFLLSRMPDPAEVVPGKDYVSYAGTDSFGQGQAMADWLTRAVHGTARIIELEGTLGSSPAIGRKKGFEERIAEHPGMKLLASEPCNYDRPLGHDVAKRLLAAHPDADVVYAHNDAMALGAVDAIRELGKVPGKDVLVTSVGGAREAVQDVIGGAIAAVEFNDPRLGTVAFQLVDRYLEGHSLPPKTLVTGPIIDRTNAAAMLPEAF